MKNTVTPNPATNAPEFMQITEVEFSSFGLEKIED
jgi:hypothetical protein